MPIHGDLEIRLVRTLAGGIQAELRLNDPTRDLEAAPVTGATGIDSAALRKFQSSPDAYGSELTRQLWQDQNVTNYYRDARTAFDLPDRVLRVRLLINPDLAVDLNPVRWELLNCPVYGERLSRSQRVLFSRFMFSVDWRPARKLQTKADLRTLIAVAAPNDLDPDQFAVVQGTAEFDRAGTALKGLHPEKLGDHTPVTLDALIGKIESGVDILYLVCHGYCDEKRACILLQDEQGGVKQVNAGEFASRIRNVPNPPRLIVLASCESAKHGTSALAPLLAAAGVPAVIAMQETIAMETIEKLMPKFFEELQRDGQIDRALAAARDTLDVAAFRDFWVPALFLRIRAGRLWYEPGFTGETGFDQWDPICASIVSGKFVSILGPDFAEHVYGTSHALAAEIAKENVYLGPASGATDLTKVAQYLSARHSLDSAQRIVQTKMEALAVRATFDDPEDPCRIMADLVLRYPPVVSGREPPKHQVCVNTSPDPLFEDYLAAAGGKPRVFSPSWRRDRESGEAGVSGVDKDPDPKQPVLYYVFGSYATEDDCLDSWVLTEDDFFDYLIRTSKFEPMPGVVSDALTKRSLLFLGFPLSDWKFRVLLRMILAKGSASRIKNFNHVAVQVDPDEHSLAEVQRLRRVLQDYFKGNTNTEIYWGSTADFLRQLRDRLAAAR